MSQHEPAPQFVDGLVQQIGSPADIYERPSGRRGPRVGAHRERARRRLEVEHDLGAQHLAHRDLARQRDAAAVGGQRQPLGADADDDAIEGRRGPERGREVAGYLKASTG